MTKLRHLTVGSIASVLNLIIMTSPVKAAAMTINNAGFEEPNLAGLTPIFEEEIFTFTTPPGWQLYDPNSLIPLNTNPLTSYAGVWNPSSTFFTNEAPEGDNIGAIFLNQASGSGVVGLTQTFADTLQADTQYTLQVEVGNPASDFFAGFPGYRVQLLAGEQILAEDDNELEIKEGEFKSTTIAFTATEQEQNLVLPLQIRLLNTLESTGLEVNFDDVRLSATPLNGQSIPELLVSGSQIPESNSILSLLILSMGFLVYNRKFISKRSRNNYCNYETK